MILEGFEEGKHCLVLGNVLEAGGRTNTGDKIVVRPGVGLPRLAFGIGVGIHQTNDPEAKVFREADVGIAVGRRIEVLDRLMTGMTLRPRLQQQKRLLLRRSPLMLA